MVDWALCSLCRLAERDPQRGERILEALWEAHPRLLGELGVLAVDYGEVSIEEAAAPLGLSVEEMQSRVEAFRTAERPAARGETLVGGTGEGLVTGGCMCLLTDSLATEDSLDCDGKILLLEDVDEAPHRVDAMLTHLRNSGQIQKAAGIVVGEMTRTDEKPDESIGGKPWRDIVRERLEPLGIPTVVGYPIGHMQNMLSLWLGIRARLDADKGTLTYLEEPCVG